MPRGGHFAAMEEPQMLLNDIRIFARTLRNKGPAHSSKKIEKHL
jgi:microsomal epoxide hydrolase